MTSVLGGADLFDKHAWRSTNFQFIQQFKELWRGRRLERAYLELIGESGPDMYDKFLHLCLKDPSQFIAMDNNAAVMMQHCLNEKIKLRLLFGDAFRDIPALMRETPVGIVNLDTKNGVREEWWEYRRNALQEIVSTGLQDSQAFALILNHTLDRGGVGLAEEKIARHSRALADVFGKYGLTVARLAPKESGAPELGQNGGFEIYRSSRRHIRMISARLAFWRRSGQLGCWVGEVQESGEMVLRG